MMSMLDAHDPARMQSIDQRLAVHLSYPVHFTRDLFALDNPLFAEVTGGGGAVLAPRRLLVVIDAGVVRHHPMLVERLETYLAARCPHLALVEAPRVVCGGEQVKNDPAQVTLLHEAIAHHGVDRHSFVCAIGGGAVLDMVGYAAATAHRGIRMVRVPSTVLAQNDAGIGVKNGINAYGKKNFLGTFAAPYAVLNDLALLGTLDERDWRAGLAEAVKVALLADPAFFEALERDAPALRERDLEAMTRAVRRCAELHLGHIRECGDAFETGSSRPLDFGHWAAHRLETLTDYALRHGEAVAIGIGLDATIAQLEGRLSEAAWLRILRLFDALGLPCYDDALEAHLDEPEHPLGLLRGLEEFREHLGGPLTLMLVEDDDAGAVRGVEVHTLDPERVRQAVHRLRIAAAAIVTPHAPPAPGDASPWPAATSPAGAPPSPPVL